MTLLKCENLGFGYLGNGIASPMNFEIGAGEVVALMGENGCGKSTLLKTMAGVIPPRCGNLFVQSNYKTEMPSGNADFIKNLICIKFVPPRELAKSIALVRMSGVAPDRMTVREFVSLGRSPYGGLFDGRSAEDEMQIDDALKLLELEKFENREVTSLSDGERSRVYLAEAVAQQVRVLLLDEPNAFLDIPRSHKLFKLLKKLACERNMGIVVSTHSVEYAEKYCDRIMVIYGGFVSVAKASEARSVGLLNWTVAEE